MSEALKGLVSVKKFGRIVVDIEFANAEGERFRDTINLLVNSDEIYYNIEDSYYSACIQ